MATNQPPLFAMFVEARYTAPAGGTMRTQWVLFPPAKGEYGASSLHEGRACYMTRVFGANGKKAKWKFEALPAKAAEEQLLKRIDEHASVGWEILRPVLAPMAKDDYFRIYGSGSARAQSTPYKLLRAFERVTQTRGYRLTNT